MRTIVGSLIWKEWHEHKWKLVAITAVLWSAGAILLWIAEIDAFALAITFVTMCIIPLAVFVGLGAAASERSRNTLPFLQSLPMPMWPAALAKLVVGLATLLASITLTVGFLYICRFGLGFVGVDYTAAIHVFERNSFTGRWYADCLLLCSTVAASFFIWAASAGVNRKDEVSAGAVALAVMASWYLLLVAVSYVLSFFLFAPPKWFMATAMATAPAGFLTLLEPQLLLFLPIGGVIAVFTHLVLAAWYVRRFGRLANLEVHSHPAVLRDPMHRSWLSAPRRSVFTAIAWKQFRESVPLVLAGLVGVLGLVALLWLSNPAYYVSRPEQVPELFAGVNMVIGSFVAIVVGIGVCLGDTGPGLNTFWRSRPIKAGLWFWTKYVTGMLVLLAALYCPLLATVFVLHPAPERILFQNGYQIMPLAHVAIFAAAVMTTCLVRHAVYAAILSIATVYLGVLAGTGLWIISGLLHFAPPTTKRWWEPTEAQVAFGMALSFVASTVIAWLAVRYDWGRKGRY